MLNKRRKVERRRSENAFSYGCCPLIALCWLTSFKHPSLHFCFPVVGYPLQIHLVISFRQVLIDMYDALVDVPLIKDGRVASLYAIDNSLAKELREGYSSLWESAKPLQLMSHSSISHRSIRISRILCLNHPQSDCYSHAPKQPFNCKLSRMVGK